MEDMDPGLISRLNELWRPIYPYLAQWITQWCPTKPYWVLELGPFSGGISNLLSGLSRNVRTVCLMPQHGVAQGMRDQFESNVKALVGSLERLPFMASFDVVLFRGAFFFLTLEIIREGYRVLKPGAYALLGGGYGPLTPSKEIAKIAEESKRLNYQLGKKWISRKELVEMVKDAEMERYSEILEEGGLWLLLKKGFL